MEVPYHASGASFREQYALASVLNSTTTVDAEARKSIRQTLTRLTSARLSPKEIKECLLLLMQAEIAVIHKSVSLEPAFAHAIQLAERGTTLLDRRVAYLFLQQHMPASHPAALLLVNTIRKDLESGNESRIVLALTALIHLPNEDVIPAVQSSLKKHYIHHMPSIQQLALGAAASLAKHSPDIFEDIFSIAPELLNGDDPTVLSALVDVLNVALDTPTPDWNIISTVSRIVLQLWEGRTNDNPTAASCLVIKLLGISAFMMESAGLPPEVRQRLNSYLLRVLADYTIKADVHSKVLVLQVCRQATFVLDDAAQLLVLKPIRSVLAEYSPVPNDVYWVLSCLEKLPVELWSNTLDESEVKILVAALNADDESTRCAALRLFKKADPQTLKLHFEGLAENLRTERAMEAASIMEGTGDGFAKRVRQVLNKRHKTDRRQRKRSGETSEDSGVFQDVMELVLTTLRDRKFDGDDTFRAAFTEAILTSFRKHTPGPTLTLIASATSCEYIELLSLPGEDIVQILTASLEDSTASIQEALLVAMLRVIATCNSIPEVTLQATQQLKVAAGRHIRRRCEQFEALVDDRPTLHRLTESPSSRTLPGFLASIEAHFLPSKSPPASPGQIPTSPGTTSRQLRYAAYDSPGRPTDRFKRSQSNSSRSRSTAGNDQDHNPLERTVTPGELALLVEGVELREEQPGRARSRQEMGNQSSSSTSTSYRSDLITLDESPSRPNPWTEGPGQSQPARAATPTSSEAFDSVWKELGDAKDQVIRGWCGEAPQAVIDRLRVAGTDMQVWTNDSNSVRVFVRQELAFAVLLCREGDDGSCLWILKSANARLRASLREQLQDSG